MIDYKNNLTLFFKFICAISFGIASILLVACSSPSATREISSTDQVGNVSDFRANPKTIQDLQINIQYISKWSLASADHIRANRLSMYLGWINPSSPIDNSDQHVLEANKFINENYASANSNARLYYAEQDKTRLFNVEYCLDELTNRNLLTQAEYQQKLSAYFSLPAAEHLVSAVKNLHQRSQLPNSCQNL
jgi:hypothetical protein